MAVTRLIGWTDETPSWFLVVALTLLNSLAVAAETEQNSLQIKINNVAGKPAAGVQLFVQSGDARIGTKPRDH